jgi:integrase
MVDSSTHDKRFFEPVAFPNDLTLWHCLWFMFALDVQGIGWRRCPHCNKLFKPPRKDRIYCHTGTSADVLATQLRQHFGQVRDLRCQSPPRLLPEEGLGRKRSTHRNAHNRKENRLPKIKLHAKNIQKLEPLNGIQTDWWDEEADGLVLRVAASGSRSWCVLYRIGRRFRRFTLGKYPTVGLADARTRARKALYEVSLGQDPAQQKSESRDAITFGQLGAEYLEKYAKPKKRSAPEDERILNKYLHVLSPIRAKDIKRPQIREILEDLAKNTPYQANKTLAVVRKVFNWAISRDYLEVNPCHLLAPPGEEKERDRVLSEEELKSIWTALDREDPWIAGVFRLLLLTAQRSGEVRSMRWDEISKEGEDMWWWKIPAERAKNGMAHRVPLSAPALRILETLRKEAQESNSERRKSSPWVFLSARGTTECVSDIHKASGRIRVNSKVEDFRPHDLRRTVASLMTGSGISRLVVSKILNHVESGVTKVYDRYGYDSEKREALDAWCRKLMVIVSGLKVAAR